MPRGTTPAEAFTVGKILNEAQRSVAGHKKCAAALWRLAARNPTETLQQLCDCLRHVLAVGQREAHIERVVRFAAFVPSQPPPAAVKVAAELTEGLLAFLLGAAGAADKAVRFRACQLMGAIFTTLPADIDLTDDLADRIEAAMLQRLKDKAPAVRAEAATVLARLAVPDEEGSFAEDEVTAALLRLLASDSNKEVRKAVVAALAPDPDVTLPAIIERTRDVEPEVRRMTYRILGEKDGVLDMLSPAQRALLLRRGLADRHPRVAMSAQALLGGWLRDVEGSVPELLSLLDVAANEGAAEVALRTLIAGGALDPAEMAHDAADGGSGLRAVGSGGGGSSGSAAAGGDGGECRAMDTDASCPQLLAPQEALLWRVVCEWLSSEAESRGAAAAAASGASAARESAAAEDALEALEAALPPTVGDLLAAAAAHAEAGPQHAFSTRQLLQIAARCTDMADAAGRAAASDILARLLAQPDLWAVSSASGEGDSEADDGGAATFGGAAWAGALAELAAKVYASPAEMAAAMLGAIAGVLRRGIVHDDGTEVDSGDAEDGIELGEGAWLHALGVAAVLLGGLEDVEVRGGGFGGASGVTQLQVRDLPQALLLPAMEQNPAVRREALRCVGLYCLLGCEDAASLQAPLALLRSGVAAEPEPSARAVAVAALCDAAMFWGVDQVDALLPAARAGEARAAADAADRPVADLLLTALDAALDPEAHDGSKAERAQLAAAAATGLAKLLIAGSADPTTGLEHGSMVKVLARLLPLAFAPATEPVPALRQALSAGLEAFAGMNPAATRALAAAFLPAARRGLALGLGKGQAPSLLRFMAQLLQVKQAATYADTDRGLEKLAAGIAMEIAECPAAPSAKPYVSALCKALAALPLRSDAPELPALAFAMQQVSARVARDRTAARDAATFAARVAKAQAAGGGSAAEPLDADALAALLEATSMQDGGDLLAEWPLPFEGGGATAPTPARRRGQRAAAVAPAESSDDEDEEATPANRQPPPQRRAMPSRSARKPSYADAPAESSSSGNEVSNSDSAGEGAAVAGGSSAAGARPPPKRGAAAAAAAQPASPDGSSDDDDSAAESSDGSSDGSSDDEENAAPPAAVKNAPRGGAAATKGGKAAAKPRRALQANVVA